MSIEIDLESLEGIAVGTATGLLSLADAQSAAVKMWQVIRGPRYLMLWDLRQAQLDFEVSDVRDLAAFATDRARSGEIRSAYVVAGDLEFGFARMFEVFRESEGVKSCVFRDWQSAIDWLRQDDLGE